MSDLELSQLLSGLRVSAQALNAASDEINQIIASVEQQIVESNVGLECWQALSESSPSEYWNEGRRIVQHTETQLGFAKLTEGWKLAIRDVVKETDGDEDETVNVERRDPTPLFRASRELRIEALERMPALIAGLKSRADMAIQAIARARKLVK